MVLRLARTGKMLAPTFAERMFFWFDGGGGGRVENKRNFSPGNTANGNSGRVLRNYLSTSHTQNYTAKLAAKTNQSEKQRHIKRRQDWTRGPCVPG